MSTAWNKNRLAYSPYGPYVSRRYEEGFSYNQIAKEIGIPKGCVQRLCRVIGIKSRENNTSWKPELWEKRLSDFLRRTDSFLVYRPERLTKKSKVITRCKHGISERLCQTLQDLQFCCKSSSKLGLNNPGVGWGVRSKYRSLPGTFYLIRYLDSDGIHFKVGITKRSITKRFKSNQLISILYLYKAKLGECFDLEQAVLKYASRCSYRYSSSTTTELIRSEGLDSVLKFIETTLSTYN